MSFSALNEELLQMIIQEIEAYYSGQIRFPQLVSDIGTAIDSLHNYDVEKWEKLKSKWRVLEEVNSLALDQGCFEPLEEHKEVAENTLTGLKKLISG